MSLERKLVVGAFGLLSLIGCERQKDKPQNETGNANVAATQPTEEEPNQVTYDSRFEGYEINELRELGITPEVANLYDARIAHGLYILKLARKGVNPEVSNQYDQRIDQYGIVDLVEAGIMPEVANKFDLDNFSGFAISKMVKEKIEPEVANEYVRDLPEEITDFNGDDVVLLVQNGVLPSEAVRLRSIRFAVPNPERMKLVDEPPFRSMSAEGILTVYKKNQGFDVESFDREFVPEEVETFVVNGISPDIANSYCEIRKKYAWVDSRDIVRYQEVGITFEEVKEQAKQLFIRRSLEK